MNNLTFRSKKGVSFAVLVLVLTLVNLSVVTAQIVVTPEHVAKTKLVTSSVISDDGQFVAYTVNVPADPYKENIGNRNHLYVLNTEDGTTKPYYTAGSAASVQFRPNNNSLTFLTQRDGDDTRSLYELPLDGGEAVKIFSYDRNIISYTWHHDGNHIAFTAFDESESSASPLPYTADVYEENRPQRRGYITNVDHNQEPHRIQVDGSIYLMEWSPDGSKIAISAAPSPSVDDSFMAQTVFVADYETREISAEINNEGKLGQIKWSPNGEQLALRAAANIHDPIDGRILLVSSEGGTPEIIDEEYLGKYEQIKWVEAAEIHFLASESTSSVLGSIGTDGSNKQVFFRGDEHAISSFSMSDDGLISFVAGTPQHPNEVFTARAETNTDPERRTLHNNWLTDLELGKQEVIRYEARDGEFEIEGMLIYPVGYEEGDRVPVITMVSRRARSTLQ